MMLYSVFHLTNKKAQFVSNQDILMDVKSAATPYSSRLSNFTAKKILKTFIPNAAIGQCVKYTHMIG